MPPPNKLKKLRLLLRVSRAELARRADVSARSLWAIETHRRVCRMGTQIKLLKALQVSLDERSNIFPTDEQETP